MNLLLEADKSDDRQLERGILGPLAFLLTWYSFFKKSTTYQPNKIFGIFRDTGTGRKVKVDFHYSAKVKTFISYLTNENQMTMTECRISMDTFWMCQFGSLPQMEGLHTRTHSRERPESNCQLHSHELCFLPFQVLSSPVSHTLCVFCFLIVPTTQSQQSSIFPATKFYRDAIKV